MPKDKQKDAGEGARWAVFVFVIIPFLPLGIIASILGAAWAVAREFFLAGASVFSVWDGYDRDSNS